MTSFNPDKPFASITEQIDLLRRRKLVINNDEVAKEILNTIGYYPLINGYKHAMMLDKHTYKPDTSIEDLYQLYLFDSTFCSTILSYVFQIEKTLKNRIAYYVGESIGVSINDYADPSKYRGRHKDIQKTTDKIKFREANPRDPSVIHYKKNRNHVPPWIIVHDLYFSTIIEWYKMLPTTLKDKVNHDFLGDTPLTFKEQKELLSVGLKMLLQFRNFTSHGRRSITGNFTVQLPKSILKALPPRSLSEEEYDKGIGQTGLFAVLLLLPVLIREEEMLRHLIIDIVFRTRKLRNNTLSNGVSYAEALQLPKDVITRLDVEQMLNYR